MCSLIFFVEKTFLFAKEKKNYLLITISLYLITTSIKYLLLLLKILREIMFQINISMIISCILALVFFRRFQKLTQIKIKIVFPYCSW